MEFIAKINTVSFAVSKMVDRAEASGTATVKFLNLRMSVEVHGESDLLLVAR